ncbi:gp436 family protein [Oceanobacter kriegii]|uniref:gp436 family protein n=1 Tax=Oceanobacter kriegii TaxID=64972 RepID=UPI0003FFB5CD|nr:phage protein Gp36 family protein [Oceanobacter kriegii]
MAIYAAQSDISARYSQDQLLLLTDRDQDDAPDANVVDQALQDASAEIDTYLAAKYQLPLPQVPAVLTRLCVDVAVYRLAADADMATEERRQRYDDAVSLLKRLATGAASLGLEQAPASSSGAVFISGGKRNFKRGRLL